MRWLLSPIHARIDALAVLRLDIQEASGPLESLEEATWGRDAAGARRGAVRDTPSGLAGPSALDRAPAACREAVEKMRELYDRPLVRPCVAVRSVRRDAWSVECSWVVRRTASQANI